VFAGSVSLRGSAVRGVTGSAAPAETPIVLDSGLTHQPDLTSTHDYNWNGWHSNSYYKVGNDISGASFVFQPAAGRWGQIHNVIIDLNGHTLTFNTNGANGVWGIDLELSYNVLIENGTLVESANAVNAHSAYGIVGLGKYEVSNVNVIITETAGINVGFIQTEGFSPVVQGGRVHDCFLWNKEGYEPLDGIASAVVVQIQGVKGVEVYNNIIIGAHISIGTVGVYSTPIGAACGCNSVDYPWDAAILIHHNKIFATRRIIGWKSPSAIEIYAASNSQVYENQISTIDARGIIVQMSAKNVLVYNNTVDARYTRTCPPAWSGHTLYYVENHCFGLWLRHGQVDRSSGLRNHNNIYIVNNYTDYSGDTESEGITLTSGIANPTTWSSNTEYNIGALVVYNSAIYESVQVSNLNHFPTDTSWWKLSSPYATLDTDNYDNVVWAYSNVWQNIVNGIQLAGQGSTSIVRSSTIWAINQGVNAIYNNINPEVFGNTFIRGEVGWVEKGGSDAAIVNLHDNIDVTLSKNIALPSAPTGLAVTSRCGVDILTWNQNLETDVFQYNVYRNGSKINVEQNGPVGVTFYVDVSPGVSPRYNITAVNSSGIESKQPPQNPLNLRVK
jgi:hypothetical protein